MSVHCNELRVILLTDCPQNSWTYAINQLFVWMEDASEFPSILYFQWGWGMTQKVFVFRGTLSCPTLKYTDLEALSSPPSNSLKA